MNTKPIVSLGVLLLLLLLLGACIVPPSMFERASYGPPQDRWQEKGRYRQAAPEELAAADPDAAANAAPAEAAPAPAPQPPLYAWDGGVVDGAPQGRVTEQEGTPRGLETPPAGRMHIIELYQQVLDERDALAGEVERLRKDLEDTRLALEAKTHANEDLSARVAALEASTKELLEDNQAMAARLVQAQIRRLEAEKLLLETKLEIERARAAEAAEAAGAAGRKPAGKAKPAPEEEGRGDE